MGIRLKGAGFERFEILEKAGGPAAPGTTTATRAAPATSPPSSTRSPSSSSATGRGPTPPSRRSWPTWSTAPRSTGCSRTAASATRCGARAGTRRRRAGRWSSPRAASPHADVVVSAIGMFNEIALPDIPGLDCFAGTLFHSARWKRDHDLAGETVGVIGSAASAVQLVPEIAKQADRVHLFQRTANWVAPKEDEPYTEKQLERFRSDPAFALAVRQKIFDSFGGPGLFERVRADMEAACRANMAAVEDPDAARAAAARPSLGLQAPAPLQRLLPGLQPPEPRAGHRPDRAHHPDRDRDRRRPRAAARHADPGHRLRRDEVPVGDRRRRAAAGSRSPTPGGTGPRPTRASPRRAFRTSSCSTARTPTPTRSSR